MAGNDTVCAVVPAAGVGRRMGGATPKQYLTLHGAPVLLHTLRRLAAHPRVARIVVAIAAGDPWFDDIRAQLPATCMAVTGGAERCHSVLAGLDALAAETDSNTWVLVHDAARPCLRTQDISAMLSALADSAVGGILAAPVRDTLKRCDETGSIEATVSRELMWQAQTPQMFRLGMLQNALTQAIDAGVMVTDEAQAMERAAHVPRVVQGHGDNIKITHPEDLALATAIMSAQEQEQADP